MQIFRAAVSAVDPAELVHRQLVGAGRRLDPPALVVGAGKAAARMAAGCERALGPRGPGGLVIVPDDCGVPLTSIAVAVARHPIPDQRSIDATRALWQRLQEAPPGPVLCLISGGASSLLVLPRPSIGLEDKIEVNRLLLASGADIQAINTVRKHLSLVKGGGLLRAARGRVVTTVILSDVIGDDPSLIGSGPSVPDRSTFAEADAILARSGIGARASAAVRTLIRRGVQGLEPETVRAGDPDAGRAEAIVVGSNRIARQAAAGEARRLGYDVQVAEEPLAGESAATARRWFAALRLRPGQCAIAGGETTVTVRGTGRGGRNQEFVLALVEPLAGRSLAVLSAGTDGIDGPTDAAGATADGATLGRAGGHGLDPAEALRNNDSYTFFDRLGDLIRTGPTGTNVMDLQIAIAPRDG